MGVKKTILRTISKEITFKDMFALFYAAKRAANLAPVTLENYEDTKEDFLNVFGRRLLASDISDSLVIDYTLYLQNKGLNPVSVNTRLRTLRTILYWGMDKEYIVPFKISLVKEQEVIVETYTHKELKTLLKKPAKKEDFREWRMWAIINYILATGNRAATVRNLRLQDIDFQAKEITLTHTKNKKSQVIPLSSSLETVFKEYIRLWRAYAKPTDWLFCGVNEAQLSDSSIHQSIRKYNHSRGVQRTGLHALRHTFAKEWILNNGDVFRLQKMLGHSTLEMTKRYVRMFNEDLKKDFDEYNPLDNLNKSFNKSHTVKQKSKKE